MGSEEYMPMPDMRFVLSSKLTIIITTAVISVLRVSRWIGVLRTRQLVRRVACRGASAPSEERTYFRAGMLRVELRFDRT
jgi:hypothetical protein